MERKRLTTSKTPEGIETRKNAVIDYWNANQDGFLTVAEVAEELSLSKFAVRNYLMQAGLVKPKQKVNASQARERRIKIAKQLREEGLTLRAIGKILNCKLETVADYLREV